MKKTIIIIAIGTLLLSSLVAMPTKAQSFNQIDLVNPHLNDDPLVSAYQIIFNKVIPAFESCNFVCQDQMYTVLFVNEEYHFWGYSTPHRDKMILFCAKFAAHISREGHTPIYHKEGNNG